MDMCGMTNLEWLESPVTVAYLSPEHAQACKWAANEIKRLTALTETSFAEGVVYASARLIELFDRSTMAANILVESGIDVSSGCEDDLVFIRRISQFATLPTGRE